MACDPWVYVSGHLLQDGSARLARQLADAQRQEQALMDKLGTSEGARQQQEMRLEVRLCLHSPGDGQPPAQHTLRCGDVYMSH